MDSFHQSRGRILFEVLCAFAISVSLASTWIQTGASALLPAAAAALLYGLVHTLDMAGRRSVAPNPESAEIAAADQRVAAMTNFPVPIAAGELPAADDPVPEMAALIEPTSPPARKARQRKAPRKKAKVAEIVPAEEAKAVERVPAEEPEVVAPLPLDEEHHGSVTPLFEPEPFVRQQRAVFGRKAGLAFRR